MIRKLLICIDNKLVLYKFQINRYDNKIVVSCNKEFIKIPIYNNFNCLDYITINMPLELIIIDNYIFYPYIILSTYNSSIDNEIDFFYNLEKHIFKKYNINFYKYKDIKTIYIQNYINNNCNNNIWLKINLLKLLFINNDNNKEYKILFDRIKEFKYNININDKEIIFNFNEWNNYIKYNINLKYLLTNNYYYILSKSNNNIFKIKIINKNNNIIQINNNKNINYNDYKWFYYYPKSNINIDYLLYNFFINNDINLIILKFLYNYNLTINYNEILNYYNNYILSDLITLNKLDEFEILKSKSFTSSFFKKIVCKYKNNENKIIQILNILFNIYTYPFKINKNELDDIFDYILYISLYNYKILYINDILKNSILNIIPIKLKNLYLNILKVLLNIINNNFDNIKYSQKYYSDYLHRNIIKIFLIDNTKISVELFINLIDNNKLDKLKSIFIRNLLLLDISYKLSWNTLSKKINYLEIFYENMDIVFFHNKINKNIITDNFDIKIKKIIENPLEMYKYLKYENDFIKWTQIIINKINDLYHIPIMYKINDIINIGKMIYLLLNINEQNIKEISYINFINFCMEHSHLILNNTRINLKIKEKFSNLKCNINLGYLAKDLTVNMNSISFDINNYKNNIEHQLQIAINKYLKYKNKYLKYKNNNLIINI
jgi:hypothetical protein